MTTERKIMAAVVLADITVERAIRALPLAIAVLSIMGIALILRHITRER